MDFLSLQDFSLEDSTENLEDNTIDPDSILEADGKTYDLTNLSDAIAAQEQAAINRAKLKEGTLTEYEGYSTEYGGGGRARLLYDQVRADLAVEFHKGKHNMTWKEQHEEATKVVRIVAIKTRGK